MAVKICDDLMTLEVDGTIIAEAERRPDVRVGAHGQIPSNWSDSDDGDACVSGNPPHIAWVAGDDGDLGS